jgi:hypothetical protein
MKLPILGNWKETLSRWAVELRNSSQGEGRVLKTPVGYSISTTSTSPVTIPDSELSFSPPTGEQWIGIYTTVMNLQNGTANQINAVSVAYNGSLITGAETFVETFHAGTGGREHQVTVTRQEILQGGANTFSTSWWCNGGTLYSARRISYLTVFKI